MSAIGALFIFVSCLAVAAMLVARIFFSDAISKPAIRRWAVHEQIDYAFDDHDIIEDSFDRGPFLWRTVNTQKVYRLLVTVRGEEKVAYVRVGHWLLGLLYPVVSMRLKEPIQ
jgi:hypothetical protein